MRKKLFFHQLLFFFALCSAKTYAQSPSVQASNVQVTYKYNAGNAATLSWTRGNGEYCMVVLRKSTSSHSSPPGSTVANYLASSTYGSGASLGNGDNFVMYKGTGTAVTMYNLTPNTIYRAYVYEYNDATILGTTYYYFNTSTSGYEGFSTLDAPSTSCGSITSASSITNSSATINFSAGNGDGRFVILVRNGLSVNSPTDGYYYSASSIYGSGAQLGSGYAVYHNTGTNVNVTGLAGATTYRAYSYEYTNGAWPTYSTYDYNTKNYTYCATYTFNTTNTAPTLNSISNYTVCQDAIQQSVSLSGISDGSTNETQSISISASSSNTALVPTPTVSYSSPNSSGTLFYKPNAGQSGTAVISVTVNDGWTVNNTLTRTFTVTVKAKPGAAGSVAGNSVICAGLNTQSYSIAPTTNTTGYTWLMPSGFTVTAGSGTNNITVTTSTATTSGTMTVYATNSNGCGNGTSSTKSIQVDAQPADAYAGPDQPTVCGTSAILNATSVSTPDAGQWSWLSGSPVPSVGSTTVSSTSISGLTGPNNTYQYVWTVQRAGSICPAKQDTVTISTDWNNVVCQPASNFGYSPSSDVAGNKVCVNTQLNFTDLSVSANQWEWDFEYAGGSPNVTSTLQNPVYTYTAVGTYTVYLRIWSNATSQYYTSQQTITVIGAPATPGTIFGTTSGICQGSASQYVYSVGTVTDATTYNWTTPTGINIDAYPSPTSIATSYSTNAMSGNITVSAGNSCGTSSASTLSVTVSPLPASSGATISGPATVCQAQSTVTYSIGGYANASSYTWIDLGGMQATGTNTYSTNIASNASSGVIYVWGTNSCGDGDTVSLAVSVNPLPAGAGGTMGLNNVNLCPPPGNQLYTTSVIANATTYNWSLPSGALVAGGNGADSIYLDYTAVNGGPHDVIVYGSNSCGNGASDTLSVMINTPTPPMICMVTVDDSSTHNIIYWDKTPVLFADSFRIYREDATNVYTKIGTVHYNALSEFHDYDSTANPNVTTKRYKIASVDSCGNESAWSPYHNTIYIVDNGSGQFSWNLLYTIENGPNPVTNYVLMVDSLNNGNWVQRASTAGTQQNINDIYYNNYSTVANWRVETAWNISCTATNKTAGGNGSQAAVVKSKSNITNNRTIGIRNNEVNAFAVYPNPTSGSLYLNLTSLKGKIVVTVASLIGQEVSSSTLAAGTALHLVDLSALPAGTYVIKVITDKGVSTQKVVKQ